MVSSLSSCPTCQAGKQVLTQNPIVKYNLIRSFNTSLNLHCKLFLLSFSLKFQQLTLRITVMGTENLLACILTFTKFHTDVRFKIKKNVSCVWGYYYHLPEFGQGWKYTRYAISLLRSTLLQVSDIVPWYWNTDSAATATLAGRKKVLDSEDTNSGMLYWWEWVGKRPKYYLEKQ